MPTKKPKYTSITLPVVAVEWVDATYANYDGPDTIPTPMLTFGILIENTPEHIKLAGELWANGGQRHFYTIGKQKSGMNPKIRKVGKVTTPASFLKYLEKCDQWLS